MDPDLYRDPSLYDILHTPGTAREVDGLLRIQQLYAPEARRWLEPACGTGRYLRVLTGRGIEAVGFDLNPEMVAYASQRLPSGRVFVADMTTFAGRLPSSRIGFAFNPINTIRHLVSEAELQRHLTEIANVLEPNGVYAVGLSLTDYDNEVPTEDVWEARRGRCRVRQLVQYLPPPGRSAEDRFEKVVSHLVVEKPTGTNHLDDTYVLRAYDEKQWARAIARSPLRESRVVDEHGRDVTGLALAYGIHLLHPRG